MGRPRVKPSAAALVCAAALGALGACGSDAPTASPGTEASSSTAGTTTTTVAPAVAPFAVEHSTVTLVDATRPTPQPAAAERRTLETEVYVPDGPGRFPLIVHAHGFNGAPLKFSELLGEWAAAGYIVAAPRFPLTSDTGPGTAGIADYEQQPADVSFVIDQLLASDEYAPRIDAERIGVSGLSLGGGTIYGLMWHTCCRDERVDAAIVMSGLRFPFDGAYGTNDVPVMILHGDADPALPYEQAVESYEMSAPPKWFVQLIAGAHASPYENDVSPHDALVTTVTLDFWAGTLGDDPAALARIVGDGTIAGLAAVTADP
jgi:predicted dienelactone hydrolase